MHFILDQLQTDRLRLRKIKKSDADVWMEFFNSPEALEFLPFKLASRKACEEWIDKQLWRYKETHSGLCAVLKKDTREMVGQIGLLAQEVDGEEELEIGYHLIPRFWKNGYATEVAKAAKEYVFKNNLADSLISIVHIHNKNSQAVALRNGMKVEKQTDFKGFPVLIFRVHKDQNP